MGGHLGQSEQVTKGILASTKGKVLVIDEAYSLCSSKGQGNGGQSDAFKTAVVDTIVAEVQGTPGEDRCVLLLGYKDQMETMMQDANPGLRRRFSMEEAFYFEDFDDAQLKKVLKLKLQEQGMTATGRAIDAAMECLQRSRNRPHFGNAGEVDNLLNAAKLRNLQRLGKGGAKAGRFDAVDLDPDFDRSRQAGTNVQMLFKDVVGQEKIIKQLEKYQKVVANMKARGSDPREEIPFNFLFRGPPGEQQLYQSSPPTLS